VEKILVFNQFFAIVDTCISCEDIVRQSCAIVRRRRFFRPILLDYSSVVCQSVCHDRQPCENGGTDHDAVRGVDSG